MASETRQEQDARLEKLQKRYLAGDNSAGDAVLNEYEGLIKSTVLNYWERHDIYMGFSVEDAFQIARLKILQSLKHFDIKRCTFTYFVADSSVWACGRMLRWCSSLKRHHSQQVEYDNALAIFIQDNSVRQPYEMALENELFSLVEAKIATLDAVCQAVYHASISGHSPRGYDHPLLKTRGGSSLQNKLTKVRCAVREVLTNYNEN